MRFEPTLAGNPGLGMLTTTSARHGGGSWAPENRKGRYKDDPQGTAGGRRSLVSQWSMRSQQ